MPGDMEASSTGFRPAATMPTCEHGGAHVSAQFERVFDDESGQVHACSGCSANAGIAEVTMERARQVRPAHSAMSGPRTPDPAHFVYVLRCGDDTLYTGYTTDPERRVREHDDGDGAKYTRGRAPVELVHLEGFDSQSVAMSREHEIKQLSRSDKERLVERGGVPDAYGISADVIADEGCDD